MIFGIVCVSIQVSGLLNRPEIPKLAGLNKSLLVKAYDLGLIDALGRTEGPAVRQLLQTAQDKVRPMNPVAACSA